MLDSIDHLIIAVEDLDLAESNYQKVLGTRPVWRGVHEEYGTANSIFNFDNTYLELLSANGKGIGSDLVNHILKEEGEGLSGIVFGSNNLSKLQARLKDNGFVVDDITSGTGINLQDQAIRKWKNIFLPPELTRGLFSFFIQHTEGSLPKIETISPDCVNKLDHAVINSPDIDDFIKIYKDVFGLRLALDIFNDHWKKRMLFFRLNKTTLEVIEDNDLLQDQLWGLAWEVKDIEAYHKRLQSEGVDVSPIRKGLKENTLVSTVESNTHNVPTLIIQHLTK
jgi:catechol 2,3-dioxygenase-like lactoylglutathione lyase family enzyme